MSAAELISPAALPLRDPELDALEARASIIGADALLAEMISSRYRGRIALVSSFGAESAVMLHLVASIDRAVPVIFLDTGKHFRATLDYRDRLVARLGLRDVRSTGPDAAAIARADSRGDLWRRDPDRCCALRKVEPLARALDGFDAWITGRKRFQASGRRALPVVERLDGRIKINPLADWAAADIDAYFASHGLPRHPLWEAGYGSIGCEPCTTPTKPGEDLRAGRWRGLDKDECGIHFVNGAVQRAP